MSSLCSPKHHTIIICIILLSILIPTVMYSFHFYYDPGYYNNFNFRLTIPIPKPVEDTVPPVTNSTPINVDLLFEELSHHFSELISHDPPKLFVCPHLPLQFLLCSLGFELVFITLLTSFPPYYVPSSMQHSSHVGH